MWLARVQGEGGAALATSTTAAVKLFRRDVSTTSIDAEIEALSRIRSPHVARVDDVMTDAGGRPALVLQRLQAVGLVQLLGSRESLGIGEAVTILVPLARTLALLHGRGIAHNSLGPAKVLFDDEGTPVLCGFGAAVFGTENGGVLKPEQQAAARLFDSDRTAMADLARGILLRTDAVEDQRVVGLLEWLGPRGGAAGESGFTDVLVQRLFEASDPVAIGLAPPAERASWATRGGRTGALRSGGTPSAEPAVEATIPSWLTSAGMPDWIADALAQAIAKLRPDAVASRLRNALRSIRPRFWVLIAVLVVGGIAALLLLDDTAASPEEAPGEQLADVAQDAPAAPEADTGLGGEENAHVLGDDPVEAARALLMLREHCFETLSVLCLDDVDQLDSVAWEADRHAIRMMQEGADAPTLSIDETAGSELLLVDRMGDTALVSSAVQDGAENEPASVLMIRTEAGWRIRDLFTL